MFFCFFPIFLHTMRFYDYYSCCLWLFLNWRGCVLVRITSFWNRAQVNQSCVSLPSRSNATNLGRNSKRCLNSTRPLTVIGFGAVNGGVVVFGARALWRVVFGWAVHRRKVLTVVLRYRNWSLLSKYVCKGSVEKIGEIWRKQQQLTTFGRKISSSYSLL